MHPLAYYHLNNLDEVQFFQRENIGKLQFSSMYIPIVDPAGRKYAYLQIPYYTARNRQNQEISSFLVTIINLNAFIFLLAGIVAFFITNRITRSFSIIVNQMKKVSFSTRNEPIVWERNDEIGALVSEYNKMVNKLEESAQALAKSEREGAWREMARQIAHEIKNPLTPMKLSLQYLERSIDNKDPNISKLASDVSKTLIEQIDHLNHIANEFSQFANIEQAKPEIFDLNEALRAVLNLFRSGELLHINPVLLSNAIMINADRSHINRVFTNLLQNAIQAVPSSKTPDIRVEEELSENRVIIRVTDNGEGIDEAVQPFIFTPNFTTKTSGTGLGLAMCKRMIEQAGGSISFFTIPGKGTTFLVVLPLSV
jgi:nitrogen fixation/metabolism regulation signal transduction histidine kinase